MVEVEVGSNKKVKTSERYSIPEFHVKKEIGGMLLGYNNEDGFELVKMVQVRNKEKDPASFYKMSFLDKMFKCCKSVTFKEIKKGIKVIGAFHSHPNGSIRFSKRDFNIIKERVAKHGVWVEGLLVPKKGGNRCEMILSLFDKRHLTTNRN